MSGSCSPRGTVSPALASMRCTVPCTSFVPRAIWPPSTASRMTSRVLRRGLSCLIPLRMSAASSQMLRDFPWSERGFGRSPSSPPLRNLRIHSRIVLTAMRRRRVPGMSYSSSALARSMAARSALRSGRRSTSAITPWRKTATSRPGSFLPDCTALLPSCGAPRRLDPQSRRHGAGPARANECVSRIRPPVAH